MPAPKLKNRIVGSGEESPDQLLANPGNWRIHPMSQQAALEGSLERVGWVQQVMVNRVTGHVVDGHARVALALRRDEPKVPVLYVELTPEEEITVLATLDPIAAMAGTDREKLGELLGELDVGSDGLSGLLEELSLEADQLVEDGNKPGGMGRPIVATTLVFDDEDQQRRWHQFLRGLRTRFPEMSEQTNAARLDRFLTELGPMD